MDAERWHVVEPDGYLHHAAVIDGALQGFESGKAAARYIAQHNAAGGREIPAAARVEGCNCGR